MRLDINHVRLKVSVLSGWKKERGLLKTFKFFRRVNGLIQTLVGSPIEINVTQETAIPRSVSYNLSKEDPRVRPQLFCVFCASNATS